MNYGQLVCSPWQAQKIKSLGIIQTSQYSFIEPGDAIIVDAHYWHQKKYALVDSTFIHLMSNGNNVWSAFNKKEIYRMLLEEPLWEGDSFAYIDRHGHKLVGGFEVHVMANMLVDRIESGKISATLANTRLIGWEILFPTECSYCITNIPCTVPVSVNFNQKNILGKAFLYSHQNVVRAIMDFDISEYMKAGAHIGSAGIPKYAESADDTPKKIESFRFMEIAIILHESRR